MMQDSQYSGRYCPSPRAGHPQHLKTISSNMKAFVFPLNALWNGALLVSYKKMISFHCPFWPQSFCIWHQSCPYSLVTQSLVFPTNSFSSTGFIFLKLLHCLFLSCSDSWTWKPKCLGVVNPKTSCPYHCQPVQMISRSTGCLGVNALISGYVAARGT